MTTHFKNVLSVFAISIFIIIALASTSAKRMTFTTSSGQIPPEFNTFRETLLVISHFKDGGYNRFLKKNFEESYTGKYK